MRKGRARISLLFAAWVVSGCGVRPEDSILEQFFAASRLLDRTALQDLATVVYEPLQQGIVTRFEILKVDGDERAKIVTVAAQVKRPDGREAPATLIIVMQRDGGQDRWTITGVTDSQ